MIAAIVVLSLLILVWIGVFVLDRDAWPFSSYPMFSQCGPLDQVNVFRIRIEDTSGQENWWNPPVTQVARDFDRGFREAMKRSVMEGNSITTQFATDFFSRWNQAKGIVAIQVVGRTPLADQVILRIPLTEVKADG